MYAGLQVPTTDKVMTVLLSPFKVSTLAQPLYSCAAPLPGEPELHNGLVLKAIDSQKPSLILVSATNLRHRVDVERRVVHTARRIHQCRSSDIRSLRIRLKSWTLQVHHSFGLSAVPCELVGGVESGVAGAAELDPPCVLRLVQGVSEAARVVHLEVDGAVLAAVAEGFSWAGFGDIFVEQHDEGCVLFLEGPLEAVGGAA